jgi:very-short-patch-repair endonuclease
MASTEGSTPGGFQFRRQQALGPYIVDFLCIQPKLVIEIDGGQHAEQTEQDTLRSQYLQGLGYRVIRFWNDEVLGDMEAVLGRIRAVLMEIPLP